MMGKQQGFNEDRGQMFFRIKDILEVKMPKYVLLENVKNLYTHDKGNTFKVIKNDLESLGYHVYSAIFNTSLFHLPQTRNRVLIFATTESGHDWLNEEFNCDTISAFFDSVYQKSSVVSFDSVLDLLKKDVDQKYFLSEGIKPTILSDGSGGFKSKSDIDLRIARPLTATMHKMHRACQDNYYSQDFISTEGKRRPSETFTKEELCKLPIRRLTPVEAFSLQGFSVEFAQRASEKKVADGALYKQAGNAVSVNVIYAVVHYLICKGVIKE
jgi:DNA (cytosine-5)-methyltransferase 1